MFGYRFPETLSAVDFEGRTALHYAAVIPDNGHYYNLLQQLGANAKDLDDVIQTLNMCIYKKFPIVTSMFLILHFRMVDQLKITCIIQVYCLTNNC